MGGHEKVTDDNAEDLTRERYQSASYAKLYKSEYVKSGSLKALRSKIIANKEIRIIHEFLEDNSGPGMKVLDLPCGTGKLGGVLSEIGVDVIAADVSLEMLDLAKNEYRNSNVDYRVLDATQIALQNNSGDLIVCLRLFQRLPASSREKILSEFGRISTGRLIISYSYTSVWQRVRRLLRSLYVKENTVFFSRPISEIISELKKFGYELIDIRYVLKGLSSEVIILVEHSDS